MTALVVSARAEVPASAEPAPETFRGLWLQARQHGHRVRVDGRFVLPRDELRMFEGGPHGSIVVVVSSPSHCVAFKPYEGAILFEDDLVHRGAVVEGFVHVELDVGRIPSPHGYGLHGSLGLYLSPPVFLPPN